MTHRSLACILGFADVSDAAWRQSVGCGGRRLSLYSWFSSQSWPGSDGGFLILLAFRGHAGWSWSLLRVEVLAMRPLILSVTGSRTRPPVNRDLREIDLWPTGRTSSAVLQSP